jgi:hypothetical protein
MGGWGRNIAPETLHVSMGYVSKARIAQASRCTSNRRPKLDMFQWVVGFKVLVLKFMFCDV